MAKENYLTQYGQMAERHWREFRPNMVRELEAKGVLMEALFEAQERTLEEMEALTRQLETEQKLTPQQAHNRAWEMIREKYILLVPEENLYSLSTMQRPPHRSDYISNKSIRCPARHCLLSVLPGEL
jgi:hypothetical protein